jgi:hypothetical protein
MNVLSDPGMVDELGIGSIRDPFSDTLSVGISTIQTRAKCSVNCVLFDFRFCFIGLFSFLISRLQQSVPKGVHSYYLEGKSI